MNNHSICPVKYVNTSVTNFEVCHQLIVRSEMTDPWTGMNSQEEASGYIYRASKSAHIYMTQL